MKKHKKIVKICGICQKFCSKCRKCRKVTKIVLNICEEIDKISIKVGNFTIKLHEISNSDLNIDLMKKNGCIYSSVRESNIKKEVFDVNDFYPKENIRWFEFEKIDIARRKQIAQIATEIRRDCNIISEKFDVLRFLSVFFNFAIKAINFEDKNVTGMLLVDDKNMITKGINRLIAINSIVVRDKEKGMQKTRFIALHEFGHFILHKGDSVQFAKRDTGHFDTEEEREAEYFAYCMMMPEDLVRSLVNNEDDNKNKIEYVSKTFGVTISKAANRLRELEMLVN